MTPKMGNSSITHVTFVQSFYVHWATIKHLVDQSNKFEAYDDLGLQNFVHHVNIKTDREEEVLDPLYVHSLFARWQQLATTKLITTQCLPIR